MTEQFDIGYYASFLGGYINGYSTTYTSCKCRFHNETNKKCIHISLLTEFYENWTTVLPRAKDVFESHSLTDLFAAIAIVTLGLEGKIPGIYMYNPTLNDNDVISIEHIEFYHCCSNVTPECLTYYSTTEDSCSCSEYHQHSYCYHNFGKILTEVDTLIDQIDEKYQQNRNQVYLEKCESAECGVCYEQQSIKVPCCRQSMCMECWTTMEMRGMVGCPFCRTQLEQLDDVLQL